MLGLALVRAGRHLEGDFHGVAIQGDLDLLTKSRPDRLPGKGRDLFVSIERRRRRMEFAAGNRSRMKGDRRDMNWEDGLNGNDR
jgi:hypothetical protein